MFRNNPEYSRSVFDAAKQRLNAAKKDLRQRYEYLADSPLLNPEAEFPPLSALFTEAETAYARLEALKTLSFNEARELNERYEQLRRKAEDALCTLFAFERDKLGMHTLPDTTSSTSPHS